MHASAPLFSQRCSHPHSLNRISSITLTAFFADYQGRAGSLRASPPCGLGSFSLRGSTCNYETFTRLPCRPLHRFWYSHPVSVAERSRSPARSGLFTVCNAIICSVTTWNFGLVRSTKPGMLLACPFSELHAYSTYLPVNVDVYLIFLGASSLFSIFTLCVPSASSSLD